MRAIQCKKCGVLFGTEDPHRKYCEECSKVAYKHRALKTYNEDPEDSDRSGIRCTGKIAKKCIYGGTCGGYPCCDYILIEGNRRPCPANMCDKYAEGEKLEAIL